MPKRQELTSFMTAQYLNGLLGNLVNFLPRLRIEIVVASDLAGRTVDAVSAAARTGQIGDGKIFVTPVEHALRIRTGETDGDAL